MVTPTPEDITARAPATSPSASRHPIRPSWSASSSWSSPQASDPVKETWKAQTMFWDPGPNSTSTLAAAVAIHGLTPARRITIRSITTTARW